jgi:hypothetical protein
MVDWATVCESEDTARQLVGHRDLVFNKIALPPKTRKDGSPKHRIIWDLRRPGVNQHVVVRERIVLPRLRGVALALAALAGGCSSLFKSQSPGSTPRMPSASYRCAETNGGLR